jgi:hypothetical protein
VDDWIARGRQFLDLELAGRRPADSAAARIGLRRLRRLLEAYLRRDAQRDDAFATAMLEARFGFDPDGPPALEFEGWKLHGSIDRVDIDPARGLALVHDYKLGRKVVPQASFGKRRRLQLALYLRAVERVWKAEVAAGLYQPLGGGSAAVPRGLGRSSQHDESLAALGLPKGDWVDDAVFDERLREAEELAGAIVGGMREGSIDRNPLDGRCPFYCTFAPICRIDQRLERTGGGGSASSGEGG